MTKAYVIFGSSGCYSDYMEYMVAAYVDQSLAEATCHQMNIELKAKKEANREGEDDYDFWLEEKWDYKIKEVDLYE